MNMIPEPGPSADSRGISRGITAPSRRELPPRSPWVSGCRRPRCVWRCGLPTWVRCGRAGCSPRCRRIYGRRLARVILKAGEPSGTRAHAVIRRRGGGSMTGARAARARALKRAARRLGGDLWYFWVAEWSADSGYHEHLLIVSGRPMAELRESFRSVELNARDVDEIRSWTATVKYVCGDLNNRERWAEPTPAGFRGRLHGRTAKPPAVGSRARGLACTSPESPFPAAPGEIMDLRGVAPIPAGNQPSPADTGPRSDAGDEPEVPHPAEAAGEGAANPWAVRGCPVAVTCGRRRCRYPRRSPGRPPRPCRPESGFAELRAGPGVSWPHPPV
jgi:hypothetical protein